MRGIVAPVVHPISDVPVLGSAAWVNSDIIFDYAIGGQPFLSGANAQYPIERKTAPYTKQQIDQGTEAGEQTLVNWWLRSQSSFHDGTGIVFEEPISTDATVQYRFADSAGVNVWKPGHVTLLNSTTLDVAATAPIVMGAIDSTGADCYFIADGSTLKRATGTGSGAAVTWGGSGTILSMCNDGTNYYVADNVGVWKGTLTGGAGSKVWNTGSSTVVLGWVKQRLMAAIGASIYQLVGGSPPTLPTALYTHPSTGWVWTSVTESPEALYFAGHAGATSAVFMFTLDTSGAAPTLTSGITVAQLPEGEVIHSIYGYLGTYVAIGTNKGVRIADVQSDGSLQYGPLSVNLPHGAGAVESIVGGDRFIYCTLTNGIAGQSGLLRLDLGSSLGYKQFAWANDLQAHVTGRVGTVCLLGASDRLVFSVDGHGAYLQSASTLEPSGYLKTGNIRFHTLEPKLFKFVRVLGLPLTKGGISITANDHAGNATSLVAFTAGVVSDPLDEVALPTAYGQQGWISLTIGLTRDSGDTTAGPTVTGYQVKALPAQKRQRLFVLPLLCYDHESDANGEKRGSEGSAIQRILALEAIEESGDVVQFQDLTANPQSVRQVVIDNIEYQQTSSPKESLSSSGWGGRMIVTLRTVT